MCLATANKVAYIYSKDNNGNFVEYSKRPHVFVLKASTVINFSNSEEHLLIGDRHGTLTRYGLTDESIEKEKKAKKISVFGEPNELGGEGLVGHISMILDFDINEDDTLIFTGDRDEKIKVCRYPESYVIEQMLLGHKGYISSVISLPDNKLLSGGSDGWIFLWNVKSGQIVDSTNFDGKVIRRIKLIEMNSCDFTVIITFEGENYFKIVKYSNNKWNVSDSIKANNGSEGDFFFDIVFTSKYISVNKSGFYEIDPTTYEITNINERFTNFVDMQVVIETLKTLIDPLPALHLCKDADSSNIDEYMRKKEDRISKKIKIAFE
ncbi:tRNA (guanine-N(7)-)-methyltransferase non-catalytic subunit WDR4 [Strongyloides ratti]|uniref:tRNA (Guanine-N(7)-)-methyltransferase non-catalytic subunit WDR4 n=1 Tax=Strongyloides ratti TaxID=34506 RepID=A0A090L655_STRRB|nr:tRNA (guanine-N(7)-)-methyltransferase non-catalytic subunit WDR4 [Strongyloides ratti]CEF65182.1 tRNA (guanine-N(7)-)-methyltransferase non-catalytic subunit WDR4 [Strongyloides ratti]